MVSSVKAWLERHGVEIGVVLLLFVVALVPRALDLGVFLTADEKNWIGRSFEFVKAFKDFRFNDMLQTTHPGVITLWLSGAAVTAQMIVSHIPFSFRNLPHFVTAAQLPIATTASLMVPVIYFLLRQLWGGQRWLALTASLFIALNPFIVGYSRVVHVDALLASFLFAAALATLIWAERGWPQRWLIVSAVLAALALLSKAPAVFIVPYFVLVVLVYGGRQSVRRDFLAARGRDIVLWLLLIGICFVALWPAILWVPNPEGNVLVLKRDIGQAAVTPHHMAAEYTLNSSFYIGTLLSRVTPVGLFLAAVCVGWLLFGLVRRVAGGRNPKSETEEILNKPGKSEIRNLGNVRRAWMLLAYVVFFVVMMMLGAKKGDRYILPVFPALDVIAAFGLAVVAAMLANVRNGFLNFQSLGRRTIYVGLAGSVVLFLGVTVARYHPYAIAYSSSLFPDNLSQELGWGEGLDQVGSWLSETSPNAVVASWYPEELDAYTSAHVAHINAHEQGKVRYVVLYRNMFGRAPDHYANDFIDEYFKKRDPVFVAQVAGKDFAWVYEKRVYERVIGELTPGVVAGQEITVPAGSVSGLDVLAATYSGRAAAGELYAVLRSEQGGSVLQEWRVPVEELEDNGWLTLKLSKPLSGPRSVYVEIRAAGTSDGNAPTVRYTRDNDYRESGLVLNGEQREGDLGVRLRFDRDGEIITEDDTRLLQ